MLPPLNFLFHRIVSSRKKQHKNSDGEKGSNERYKELRSGLRGALIERHQRTGKRGDKRKTTNKTIAILL